MSSSGGATAGGATIGPAALGNITGAQILAATKTLTEATCTLTGNAALTVTSSQSPAYIYIEVAQDATGGHTLTINGQSVTVNQTAGSQTVIRIGYDGTNFYPVSMGVGVQQVNGHTGASVTLSNTDVGALGSNASLNTIANTNPNTADVPMNGHKLTGLASGTAATDGVEVGQVPTASSTTGPAGIALAAAPQTLLTLTTPNDGNLHTVSLACLLEVTSALTGGAIAWQVGGVTSANTIYGSSQAVGNHRTGSGTSITVPANTVVNVQQTTGASAGAATFTGELTIL